MKDISIFLRDVRGSVYGDFHVIKLINTIEVKAGGYVSEEQVKMWLKNPAYTVTTNMYK